VVHLELLLVVGLALAPLRPPRWLFVLFPPLLLVLGRFVCVRVGLVCLFVRPCFSSFHLSLSFRPSTFSLLFLFTLSSVLVSLSFCRWYGLFCDVLRVFFPLSYPFFYEEGLLPLNSVFCCDTSSKLVLFKCICVQNETKQREQSVFA
jgi:hypothetical protein